MPYPPVLKTHLAGENTKRFILEKSYNEFYISHSGLVLVGARINHYSDLGRTFGWLAQGNDHVAEIDIIHRYHNLPSLLQNRCKKEDQIPVIIPRRYPLNEVAGSLRNQWSTCSGIRTTADSPFQALSNLPGPPLLSPPENYCATIIFGFS